jgi:conjugative transfer region protein TrbK
MMTKRLERMSIATALALTVLFVAACAIRLRGDETKTRSPTSLAVKSAPMAAKPGQCRTVSYEQGDALSECQKIWAEKRQQFFGRTSGSSTHRDGGVPGAGSSSPVPPKDDTRLPSRYPAMQTQSE